MVTPVIDVLSAPKSTAELEKQRAVGKGAGGVGGVGIRELGTDSQGASDQATAWGTAAWYFGQLAETGQEAAGAASVSLSEACIAHRFSVVEPAEEEDELPAPAAPRCGGKASACVW